MSDARIMFTGTGAIQTYVVPSTGNYVIEAAGAQGGIGGGPGGKGARVRGTFHLTAGEVLQIVVGLQGAPGSAGDQPAGGGGGGSFVWKGLLSLPVPVRPLLAAGGGGGGNGSDGVVTVEAAGGMGRGGLCGYGGSTDYGDYHYSGGGGTGWRSNGAMGSSPTFCRGGTRWTGGQGADFNGQRGGSGGFGGGGGGSIQGCGSGGGGGYSGGGGGTEAGPGGGGGGSYNAGLHQNNVPGVQLGNGLVSLIPVVPSAPTLESDRETIEAPVRGIDARPSTIDFSSIIGVLCGAEF